MDTPERGWLSLREAPLRASPNGYRRNNELLKQINTMLSGFETARAIEDELVFRGFSIKLDTIKLRFFDNKIGIVLLIPAENPSMIATGDFWSLPLLAKHLDGIIQVDLETERRFHKICNTLFEYFIDFLEKLVKFNRWRVVARVNSPVAPRFTHIPLDSWSYFKILDGRNGTAIAECGDMLYSVHLQHAPNPVPILPPRLLRLPSLQPEFNKPTEAPSKPLSSKKAETDCEKWLISLMKANDLGAKSTPIAKQLLREQALAKFPRLSRKGFDRAWAGAVKAAEAWHWSEAGRRKRQDSPTKK